MSRKEEQEQRRKDLDAVKRQVLRRVCKDEQTVNNFLRDFIITPRNEREIIDAFKDWLQTKTNEVKL